MVINNKDYTISTIRFLAMCSIVLCHIFQFYDMRIAWWLNTGVQVFLCISGWLYAGIEIKEPAKWLWKNYLKILVDALVFIIITLPIIKWFDAGLSAIDVIKAILFFSFPDGYRHLWFLPYILLCYLITPLLQAIWVELRKKRFIRILFILVAFMMIFQVIIGLFVPYFNPAWVSCYIIAYYIRKLKDSDAMRGGDIGTLCLFNRNFVKYS